MPKTIDMTGIVCGLYTVREFDSIGSDRQAHWKCECVCGERRVVRGRDLRSGNSKSCGCKGAEKKWKAPKVTTRKCKTCKIEKNLADFHFSAERRIYQFQCRECADKSKINTKEYQSRWRQKDQKRIATIRINAMNHYGGKCACCGEDTPVFLAFDHINGGGNQHRGAPGRKKIPYMGNWLLANGYPKGFQVLCNNCNWAKHAKKLCPHQEDQAVSLLSFGG